MATIEVQNAFALTFEVLCVSFTLQMVKTRVIKLRGVEGPNARGQITLYALYSFLVEVKTNAGYIHAMHA